MTNTVTLSVTRFYYDGDPLRFAARAGSQRVKKVESRGETTVTTAYAGPIEVTITGTQRITQAYYMAGAQRVATRVITSTGSVVYYLHADHLGSASLTTNASGNKLGELRYSPYGVTRYVWGATPTDRRFTGQRSEEASLGSLYDYGARMYSPVLGRFLSADTMVPSAGNPQSLNRYAYVRNSPLKFVDPTGHYEFEEEPDDPAVRWSTLRGPIVRSAHEWTAPRDARTTPPPSIVRRGPLPQPDRFDLTLDRVTLFLDTVAMGGSAIGIGEEIGGCLSGGPLGCASGFGLYAGSLNQFESAVGIASALATIVADSKRGNTGLGLRHVGFKVGADTALAVGSNVLGTLVPEPILDTLINANSFANDVNNLVSDEAAAQGSYASPPLPVFKPGPIYIRPLDWFLGPSAQPIYTMLGGE